jgi:hypothetical protein
MVVNSVWKQTVTACLEVLFPHGKAQEEMLQKSVIIVWRLFLYFISGCLNKGG